MDIESETLKTIKKPGPERRGDWQRPFLESLRQLPNVREACVAGGVARATVYKERQRDQSFALAWRGALKEGLDVVERVAHMRATTGQPLKKTVTKRLPDGSVEITETEWRHVSDALLMFLIKRYRPEPRDSPGSGHVHPDAAHDERARKVESSIQDFFAELDRLAAPNSA